MKFTCLQFAICLLEAVSLSFFHGSHPHFHLSRFSTQFDLGRPREMAFVWVDIWIRHNILFAAVRHAFTIQLEKNKQLQINNRILRHISPMSFSVFEMRFRRTSSTPRRTTCLAPKAGPSGFWLWSSRGLSSEQTTDHITATGPANCSKPSTNWQWSS